MLLAVLMQATFALAQNDAFEEGLDWTSPSMKSDVKRRVEGSLGDLREQVDQMAPKIERFATQNFRSGQHSVQGEQYDEMPKRHPMLDTKGVADSSKQDYVQKDTRVIFNTETFAQCLEERQVTQGPYVEECRRRCTPGWVTYTGEKATSCLPCNERCLPGMPGCVPCKYNQFYVSEFYWPVYESRTYPGRGMGSFDPNSGYLHGKDKQDSLEYDKVRRETYDRFITYMKKWYKDTYDSDISEAELREAFPKDLYLAGDFTGRDLNVADNDGHTETHSNHTLVYMTNANRQLSRRMRPNTNDNWKGYVMEDKCFFNTLPDPSKLAVSHATYHEGHDELTFQYNHRKVNEPAGVKPRGSAYGHSMLNEGPQVYNLMRQVDQELRASPFQQPTQTIDSMLGQYIEMNQQYFGPGMERLGSQLHTHYQDWLYHNFFRLYHSRNNNLMEDPLYASIVAGFSFYTLNSLPTFQPNMTDGGERRPILWSFWAGRPGMDGKNYAGSKQVGPGKIFSVDKIQVIYPTLDDKNLGSQCFRPESLARSEYVDPKKQSIDDKVGSQGFWGFRRDLRKRLLDAGIEEAHNYIREVRIAYWIKRVNCHCTICASGGFLGCSVLNTGDHPDDWFYGTRSLENQRPQLTPGGTLRRPDTEFRMLGPGANNSAPDADLLRKAPEEIENEAFIANVSHSFSKVPQSEASNGAEWESAPVNPNHPQHGDYVISPFDDYYQPFVRRVADKPLVTGVPPRRTPAGVKKAQQGALEDNARKIALRRYGGHSLDDKAAQPQSEGNGDKFEIGIQTQTGTPGPVNATAEDYLANADPGDDKPANTGGPVPLPPGNLNPPSNATVAPLVYCPLPTIKFCPPCSGGRVRTLARTDQESRSAQICVGGSCTLPPKGNAPINVDPGTGQPSDNSAQPSQDGTCPPCGQQQDSGCSGGSCGGGGGGGCSGGGCGGGGGGGGGGLGGGGLGGLNGIIGVIGGGGGGGGSGSDKPSKPSDEEDKDETDDDDDSPHLIVRKKDSDSLRQPVTFQAHRAFRLVRSSNKDGTPTYSYQADSSGFACVDEDCSFSATFSPVDRKRRTDQARKHCYRDMSGYLRCYDTPARFESTVSWDLSNPQRIPQNIKKFAERERLAEGVIRELAPSKHVYCHQGNCRPVIISSETRQVAKAGRAEDIWSFAGR